MDTDSYRRKQIKHYHEPGHLHEFTFSCQERLPLLKNETFCKQLAQCIDQAGQEESIELVAFAFMPEHVHLLTCPREEKPNFGRYLARIKQPMSKFAKTRMLETNSSWLERLMLTERHGNSTFRLWLEGPGYDRNLYSPKAITASLDYMHNNPVHRRLCSRAVDWKWSSARYYHEDPPGVQHPDLPTIHGLPPGTL